MRLDRPDGVDLYFEVAGEGEPLVLVHGSWVDGGSWRPLADAGLPKAYAAALARFARQQS